MTRARAIVEWVPQNQGGRRQPPTGTGPRPYSTVVRFTDAPWPEETSWSLVVEMDPALSETYRWIADVHFLVPEAPHHCLRQGKEFELYEGKKCVARGRILDNTEVMAQRGTRESVTKRSNLTTSE